MKNVLLRPALILGVLAASCSSSETTPSPPPRSGQVVNSQTTRDPYKELDTPAATQKPNTTTSPTGSTPNTNNGGSQGTATAPAVIISTPAGLNRAGVSGWWMSLTEATPAQDSSFNITNSPYKCKAFHLINETQWKLATGWECWDYSKNVETFHISRFGTIKGMDNNQTSYTVTSGCDAASLNSQQTLAFKKGTENNSKPILTVTTATAKDLKMDKMKPGPNAEGWFLWPNATNWTVRVGCLDSSGNFSTPSGMTSSQLFDLSN